MTTRTLGAPGHAAFWRPARTSARLVAFVAVHVVSAAVTAAHAQVIAVKTAPVSDGGQFAFLPSANLGLGGLSIALPDTTLDPFMNPAKGSRVGGMRMFGAPTFFSVSRQAGGGLTLPIGVSAAGKAWFGQIALAMQEIDKVGNDQGFSSPDAIGFFGFDPNVFGSGEQSRQNRYVHGLLGRRLGERTSVAASASWWRLNAMDGVDLYYPGSVLVRQHGEASDLRLGLTRELGRGQAVEVVAVHNRFGVNQDVAFADAFWDPSIRSTRFIPRVEPNADRAETWGLHLGYMRPLADSTWRAGAVLTGNHISQPRLPGNGLPQVPGDGGRANAFNLGAGVSRTSGPWTMGLDAIFEPIWNRTWVHADEGVETLQGQSIAAGANTLENDFRFTNGIVRLGVAAAVPVSKDHALTLETGGQLHAIRYRLEQWDVVRDSRTASTQRWNEWTRSWGLGFRVAAADLRYRGQLTTGARRPGFDDFGGGVFAVDALAPRPSTSSFIGPPFLPNGLVFDKVRATTHQISLSIPIR